MEKEFTSLKKPTIVDRLFILIALRMLELQAEMKDLLDFQHLIKEENVEDQAVRIFRLMDEETKRLAIRILRTLVT